MVDLSTLVVSRLWSRSLGRRLVTGLPPADWSGGPWATKGNARVGSKRNCFTISSINSINVSHWDCGSKFSAAWIIKKNIHVINILTRGYILWYIIFWNAHTKLLAISVGTMSSRSNLNVTVFCLLVSSWHSTVIDCPSPLLTDKTVNLIPGFLRLVPDRLTLLLSEVVTFSELSEITLKAWIIC